LTPRLHHLPSYATARRFWLSIMPGTISIHSPTPQISTLSLHDALPIFSGSRQWFAGRLVGVADSADVAVVKVEIRGGTPRVAGFAGEARALARGDPVAIIGYPLGEDLPMERIGENGVIADPTLTVGTV